jgi:hypothetical protein
LGPARSPRTSTNIADASDLVEFTLKAYVGADRLDNARRMLSGAIAAPQAFLLPG